MAQRSPQKKEVEIQRRQARAAFVPSSFNAESRTIDVIWTTGATGLRYDWDIGSYYESLSLDPNAIRLDRLNNGASVLNSHQAYDLSSVIGAVVPGSARIEGGKGVATIQLSARDDVAPFVADIQSGVISHISVGYNVYSYERVLTPDAEDYPTYEAVDWEPCEISFVPIAFDDGARTRSAAKESGAVVSNKCVFINRGAAAGEGNGMTPEEIEAQRRAQEDAARAEQERIAREAAERATREAEAVRVAREAGAAAERQRQVDIRAIVRALPAEEREAFATSQIDTGATVEAVRTAVLDKLVALDATRAQNGAIVTVDDERDKWLRGAAAWLMRKANVHNMVAKHSGTKPDEPGEFRGMSLLDLARQSLERAGVNMRGLDKMALMGQALTRGAITQSTSDFALLLENVMHKTLLAAYSTTPDTWTQFCSTGTVSDFRVHNRYRMGMFGRLDAVPENGEFKNKPLTDAEKATIQAATFGNIINLSRQMLVNDDMDAFSRFATLLGRAAALSIEVDVYALLASNPTMADGNALFSAAHNNLAGTPAAVSVAAFDAMRVAMASQKEPNGNEYLDLRPAIWLGPIGIGGDARVVNDAQYDPDTANKLQRPNKVRGLFNNIVDTPRLSGTAWYGFADPASAPTIEVAFLDGQDTPVLESQDGFRVDGIEWRVRFDYGTAVVDYRGAQKNAGA